MKTIILFIFMAAGIIHGETENPLPLGEFVGTGRIKTSADFITIALSVHSDCQTSPIDAQTATDEVVTRIYKFFKTLKTNDAQHYKVLIDGGISMPYSRFQRITQKQIGQPVDREICRNTFQKVTNITLKLDLQKGFHRVFADIQDHVLKNFEQRPANDDFEGPRTYVTMATPFPEITQTHRDTLEKDALDLAVKDAKENFKAATRSCEPHRWKIHSIKESGAQDIVFPRRGYGAAAMMQNDNASQQQEAAPLRFDHIEVAKSVTVTFKFDGDRCYENTAK
jgi:uncharacterized protein YggE